MAGGLRERNHERIRTALLEVATRLFAERGFDDVSVAEIARAADVSPRTFYRYFDSKESLVLGHVDETSEMIRGALAQRPVGEPLMTSLREIVLMVVRSFEGDGELNQLRATLIATHPGLARRHLERQAVMETQLTPLLAERLGVTDPSDMRPALLAACATAAGRVGAANWIASGGQGPISAKVDEAFGLLASGFFASLDG